MMAGHETSSHTIISTLYFLHKYPETLAKLKSEIQEKKKEAENSGLNKNEVLIQIADTDYLNYAVKEALRLDPPGINTAYKTYQNIEICGVPIPAGFDIGVSILTQHYSPTNWFEPQKFIPERFDPDNKYFLTPDGKTRDPLAYIPFSFGTRSCPGQALAKLEVKVMVQEILAQTELDINSDLLENNYVLFGIGSHFRLKLKISKFLGNE